MAATPARLAPRLARYKASLVMQVTTKFADLGEATSALQLPVCASSLPLLSPRMESMGWKNPQNDIRKSKHLPEMLKSADHSILHHLVEPPFGFHLDSTNLT